MANDAERRQIGIRNGVVSKNDLSPFVRFMLSMAAAAFLAWAGVVWQGVDAVQGMVSEARKEWMGVIQDFRKEWAKERRDALRESAELNTRIAVQNQRLLQLERRYTKSLIEHKQEGM